VLDKAQGILHGGGVGLPDLLAASVSRAPTAH